MNNNALNIVKGYDMNYSRLGIKRTLRQMRSKKIKVANLFKVSLLEVLFIAVITGGILLFVCGVGAFNGVLASAPDPKLDLKPTGYATLV